MIAGTNALIHHNTIMERCGSIVQENKYEGNTSLISGEEGVMADELKKRFLDHANQIQSMVFHKQSFYTRYGKRAIDIVLSFMACVILAPLNACFAVCTYFDVGKPLLYKQSRIGKDGKPFLLIKFRNMNNKTDKDGNLLPAAQRVTKFGRFMRKYSLDELLNFLSILNGDRSIIGPRPLPMFFRERMSDRHRMREAVRPGLECPRMIDLDEDKLGYYQVQYENDVWYTEHVSLTTDLKMVFGLVKLVFAVKERSKHADLGTYFVGYNENGEALSLRMAKEQYPEILHSNNSGVRT